MILKNIYIFYLLIFLPITLLAIGLMNNYFTSGSFTLLLLTYCFIYHPLISGLRLMATGKIGKNKFWFNFIPAWNWKFFEFLFFNK